MANSAPFSTEQRAALNNLQLMGSPSEERFDRVTRMARDLFGVPLALVNLLDDEVLFTKSPQTPGVTATIDRAGTFCDLTIQRPEMLVIEDASADARFADWPMVARDGIRFYAGRPLAVDGGQRVGTLCLFDTEPRELDASQRLLLEEMALWVERELQATADRDRESAVQQQLLPAARQVASEFTIAGMNIPYHHVGGDFYLWTTDDRSVDITLADVMGKGVGAAILAATVRAGFLAQQRREPEDALKEANLLLFSDFTATETFATAFHARLDAATGTLSFVDAGHGLTILVHADGSFDRLASSGLPLGVARYVTWSATTVTVRSGDTLLTFTDGLLDLFDGTLASLADIAKLVWRSSSPQEILDRIAEICEVGEPSDDITVVALSRE